MSSDQAATEYNQLQGELEQLIVARQKLEIQLQENKIVNKELDALKDESKIYKLTGGVLLPVEQDEARSNVTKRLEFIEAEIKRCEDNIRNKQENVEKAKNDLLKTMPKA
ncbi:HGL289Cp [Eremothecium sinecaudum]|uniref:HGL289Cp n=1 Tax=Eremothecium sinecaudum TaxID=45286 RepID=A0A109UZZ3_9SACH|nr:HGL289Cp [Eremothecium sinecaudum]AMD22051.1 HGL289Cp [Eremothecium sinecaudum]